MNIIVTPTTTRMDTREFKFNSSRTTPKIDVCCNNQFICYVTPAKWVQASRPGNILYRLKLVGGHQLGG